jgi:hypothetical protein
MATQHVVVSYEDESDIIVQWLSVLLCILRASGSSLEWKTSCPGSVLRSFLSPSIQIP